MNRRRRSQVIVQNGIVLLTELGTNIKEVQVRVLDAPEPLLY